MSPLRVLFFGMEGIFSRAPLAALLAAEFDVCAVVVPALAGPIGDPSRAKAGKNARFLAPPPPLPRTIPLLNPPQERNIIGTAWSAGIPVLEVGPLSKLETPSALAVLQPDVICVACFPHLLPVRLLRLPHCGALNLHPSLLPAYRGPAPLFWVFHDGLEDAGITVHRMDARADAGDIVSQKPLTLPDGIRYHEAERASAEEGGRLLVEALRAMQAGTLTPRPQPRSAAPSAPAPGRADFTITPAWPARRAFNFIRGIAEWGQPIIFDSGKARHVVRQALAFDTFEATGAPAERVGTWLKVRCSPGTLLLETADATPPRAASPGLRSAP